MSSFVLWRFFHVVLDQGFHRLVLYRFQQLFVVGHPLGRFLSVGLRGVRHQVSAVVLVVLPHIVSFYARLLLVLQNKGWALGVGHVKIAVGVFVLVGFVGEVRLPRSCFRVLLIP